MSSRQEGTGCSEHRSGGDHFHGLKVNLEEALSVKNSDWRCWAEAVLLLAYFTVPCQGQECTWRLNKAQG